MRIQLAELWLSWLSSLNIMIISDSETLTERVRFYAASEGLVEWGKGRKKEREMYLSLRCCLHPFNVRGVLFRGGCGGEVDRRCRSVSND